MLLIPFHEGKTRPAALSYMDYETTGPSAPTCGLPTLLYRSTQREKETQCYFEVVLCLFVCQGRNFVSLCASFLHLCSCFMSACDSCISLCILCLFVVVLYYCCNCVSLCGNYMSLCSWVVSFCSCFMLLSHVVVLCLMW